MRIARAYKFGSAIAVERNETMFAKTSPLTFVLAVALSSTLATPSHADDCQAKLVTAIRSITASGPMRARIAYIPTVTDTRIDTIELADPARARWVIVQTFIAELAELEKKFTGSEIRVMESIAVGDVEVVKSTSHGNKWQYPTSKHGAESYISNGMGFANPDLVYEAKCDGQIITYLHNPTFQSYEFKTYEERNVARKKQDEEAKTGGYSSASTPSKLVLDAASGRPVTLEQDNPGARATPRTRIDVMFEYNPAIKVELPKTDYKIELRPMEQ